VPALARFVSESACVCKDKKGLIFSYLFLSQSATLHDAMAKTAKGMVGDCEALDKILYVSETRLAALSDKENVANTSATEKTIQDLMFPEDLAETALLVPVDISGCSAKFEGDWEKLVEQLGVPGTLDAILKAAELFKKSKANFSPDDRPIAMTVGEWKKALEEMEDEAEDDCGEEGGEEEAVEDGEEDEEEDGVEDEEEESEEEDSDGDEEGDEEVEEPAAKKAKVE